LDWEAINGITGIVSAICALGSIGYFSTQDKALSQSNNRVVSTYKIMSFLLACSGWLLGCLAILWIFEPYGCCPMKSEYQHFSGFLLSFPALVIFIFGVRVMRNEKI
jgi:hypothetical protein